MQDNPIKLLKFSPPIPLPGFTHRPRLARALAKGLSGRLVLLKAPAGYGKTSLLASVAQEWSSYSSTSTATALSWYALDPSDDDAAVFLEGLVESVRQALPAFGGTVRAVLRGTPDARREFRKLLATFLEELRESGQEGRTFILDGFHLITDRAIVDALEAFLRDPTSSLRLIISTQSDPKLYLSPLRSRDALVELEAEDFRFTPEEMRELLLSRAGRWVTQKVVDQVTRETGGWPSAANLAALIVARDRAPLPFERLGQTQHSYRRLAREVLFGLPWQQRDALLRLSLLRDLDPESCREGAGVADADALLREIQEAGLPVMRLSGREQLLVMEPLFRSALQQELSQRLLPHEYQLLKRRVASYYADSGAMDEAIRRLLEADGGDEAAALLERAIEPELESGHLDLVLAWLRALPTAVRRRHPRLMVQEARLSLARERLDDARVLLVAARPELEAAQDRVGMGQLMGSWSAVHLLEGRYLDAWRSAEEAMGHLSDGEAAEMAEVLWLLARSLELLGDLGSAFHVGSRGLLAAERSGRQSLAIRAMLQLGRLAHLRGDLAASLALSGRAVQRSALLGTEILALSNAGGTAASAYLERGQLQEAAVVAAMSLESAGRCGDEAAQVRSDLALFMATERLGQREFSLERLSRALTLSAKLPPHWHEHTMALQATAASLFRLGKRKEAAEKARQALQAAMATSHRVLIDQCRLMATVGEMAGLRLPLALLRLRRLCGELKKRDSRHWLSGALQLLGLGYWRLGLRWLAQSSLKRSLQLAAGESYAGPPPSLPETAKLLELAARGGVDHEMAGSLLGVGVAKAREVLAPLLSQKKPSLRKRAEETLDGIELGIGRAPEVRLLWPGLAEGEGEVHGDLSLRTFGEFGASVDGKAVEWPSEDARNLAAYLLVRRGRAVPAEEALRELWLNSEPAQANVRLQVALYRLRETLGAGYPPVDPVLDGQRTLLWEGVGCSIDVEAFREGLSRAGHRMETEKPPVLSGLTVSLLEDALELYQGAFLAGVDFDWCRSMRGELRDQLLWGARLLVSHYMAVGDWQRAIRYGLKSVRSNPLQEDVARDMMVCYHRLGDMDAVLRQYRDLKRQLARARGAWPSPETVDLHLRLLAG